MSSVSTIHTISLKSIIQRNFQSTLKFQHQRNQVSQKFTLHFSRNRSTCSLRIKSSSNLSSISNTTLISTCQLMPLQFQNFKRTMEKSKQIITTFSQQSLNFFDIRSQLPSNKQVPFLPWDVCGPELVKLYNNEFKTNKGSTQDEKNMLNDIK